MKKVLLYSGGMDSWLIDKIWKPDVKLYVDMNTRYSKQELNFLTDDVIVERLDLGKWERPDAIIPLRNLYLVMIASNYGDNICIGATAGDRVLDKSLEFANKTTDLLRYLFSPQWWNPQQRDIKVNLAFKDKTKKDLLKMYLDQGGSLKEAWEKSFSCYNPNKDKACMACKPCFRKFCAFAEFNFIDKNWISTVIPYIKENILPLIKNNTYGRGKEEEQLILKIYNQYK